MMAWKQQNKCCLFLSLTIHTHNANYEKLEGDLKRQGGDISSFY